MLCCTFFCFSAFFLRPSGFCLSSIPVSVGQSDDESSPWVGRVEQRQHRAAPADALRPAGGGRGPGALDGGFPHRGGYLQHHAGRLRLELKLLVMKQICIPLLLLEQFLATPPPSKAERDYYCYYLLAFFVITIKTNYFV